MRNSILLSIVLALWLSDHLTAQVAPEIEWQKSLGGPGADRSFDLVRTTFGEFLITGQAQYNGGDVSGVHGTNDMWVTKLNASGNLVWQKAFGGSGDDYGTRIIETFDGGFICAATSNSTDGDVTGNHGNFDVWIVKLNGAGVLEWQRSFGGSASDGASDIVQMPDSGFIFAGYSSSTDGDVMESNGSLDFWVVRIDKYGAISWEKSFGGSDFDYATSLALSSDGNVLVAGNISSTDGDVTGYHGGSDDIWVIGLGQNGEQLWQQTLGGSGSDNVSQIIPSNDGGALLNGSTNSDDGDVTVVNGNYDMWLVKLASGGVMDWQRSFGGSEIDGAGGLLLSENGDLVLVGTTNSTDGDISFNHGAFDVWVLRVEPGGGLVWETCLGGAGNDGDPVIVLVPGSGFVLVANSNSNDGDLTDNNGDLDYWAAKLYADPIGIAYPSSVNSIHIGPNPVFDILHIEHAITTEPYRIELCSTDGHCIFRSVRLGRTTLNLAGLAPGVYLCRTVGANGIVRSTKVIKD